MGVVTKLPSPLRYPGGKAQKCQQIVSYLPKNFKQFREPFVGGGSVALHILANYPDPLVWINDLNPELYHFWVQARDNNLHLTKCLTEIRNIASDGKVLFQLYYQLEPETLSSFDRAVRFFVLNRSTFSGTVDSGGYSKQAFNSRFTLSSIERLGNLGGWLDNVKITNSDYSEVIKAKGQDVAIYLDPPYLTKSSLYGKRGHLHNNFNHQQLADDLKACPHKWLLSYDDCPQVREMFAFANIYSWKLQYSMNSNGKKGDELLISNYEIEELAKPNV